MKKKTLTASTRRRKRGYSPMEQRLLALLPTDGTKLTTSELVAAHYGKTAPYFARQSLTYLMRSLAAKAAQNEERFQVRHTTRQGPREVAYWLEAKRKRAAGC